jgi:plastocyanin
MELRLPTVRAAVFAILLGACVGCDDTMTGPAATPTPTGPTPTPSAPRIVWVGRGEAGQRTNAFVDSESGTSTSTIHAGEAVEWVWSFGSHSTTSGTCPLGCVPDGLWDSGIGHDLTFQHTFPTAGTFPYFCLVHGTMMQGTVVVE